MSVSIRVHVREGDWVPKHWRVESTEEGIRGHYVMFSHPDDINDWIRSKLEGRVVEVTMRGSFQMVPHRAIGKYHLRTAAAWVEGNQIHHNHSWLNLRVRGPNLDDTIELHDQIRAGTIRPHRAGNWEAKQIRALGFWWRRFLARLPNIPRLGTEG